MRKEDIRELTRKVPFVPFRITLTSGETYEIQHPDMILATSGSAHISVPSVSSDPDPDAYDRAKIVSLVHIVKIEFLAGPASTTNNGMSA